MCDLDTFEQSQTAHYINILSQIRDKRAPDPCAVLTGVSFVHHPERATDTEYGRRDETGKTQIYVQLHLPKNPSGFEQNGVMAVTGFEDVRVLLATSRFPLYKTKVSKLIRSFHGSSCACQLLVLRILWTEVRCRVSQIWMKTDNKQKAPFHKVCQTSAGPGKLRVSHKQSDSNHPLGPE
ncbi:uncharacterized protein V6R79_017156 [Siganus canaliculatus]